MEAGSVQITGYSGKYPRRSPWVSVKGSGGTASWEAQAEKAVGLAGQMKQMAGPDQLSYCEVLSLITHIHNQ